MGESKLEGIKRQSNQLRGNIKEALEDGTSHFSEENLQLLKFHGMYQQDDRDLRKQLKKEGRDKHYMMMIRARIPGGVLTPEAYLQFDHLAQEYGNQTMRITTRQTFQLHGILKGNIKKTLQGINEVLITTLGGCGDQVRNIIACAEPVDDEIHREIRQDLLELVDRLGAKTSAYHEIWLDGEKVDFPGQEEEPLYKDVYLPRKFKLGMTIEGDNCCDIYANDLGIVAHTEDGHVVGYTLLVGGGMGRTATIKDTYPRLASPIAFVAREDLVSVCTTIVTIQRDFGNREDRRYSRFKYLLDARGLEWFTEELSNRLGRPLEAPRALKWTNSEDHLGWHDHGTGQGYLGLFIKNGRLADWPELPLKRIIREIVEEYQPMIHLTTQQNMILAGLRNEERLAIEEKLRSYNIPLVHELSSIVVNSMACPALPTCGLATAESERVFPDVIAELEELFDEFSLSDEQIAIRMTGCSNGCARPYVADIGFVGRTPGKYDLYLGGDFHGARLNERFREMVPMTDFVSLLRPMLKAFVTERGENERFGDYCSRVGLEYLTEIVDQHA